MSLLTDEEIAAFVDGRALSCKLCTRHLLSKVKEEDSIVIIWCRTHGEHASISFNELREEDLRALRLQEEVERNRKPPELSRWLTYAMIEGEEVLCEVCEAPLFFTQTATERYQVCCPNHGEIEDRYPPFEATTPEQTSDCLLRWDIENKPTHCPIDGCEDEFLFSAGDLCPTHGYFTLVHVRPRDPNWRENERLADQKANLEARAKLQRGEVVLCEGCRSPLSYVEAERTMPNGGVHCPKHGAFFIHNFAPLEERRIIADHLRRKRAREAK